MWLSAILNTTKKKKSFIILPSNGTTTIYTAEWILHWQPKCLFTGNFNEFFFPQNIYSILYIFVFISLLGWMTSFGSVLCGAFGVQIYFIIKNISVFARFCLFRLTQYTFFILCRVYRIHFLQQKTKVVDVSVPRNLRPQQLQLTYFISFIYASGRHSKWIYF